jgi:hypothetical protein
MSLSPLLKSGNILKIIALEIMGKFSLSKTPLAKLN